MLQCSNGGCLIELAQQLAVIMIGKQIINNLQEIIIPKLKAWWHNKTVIIFIISKIKTYLHLVLILLTYVNYVL